MQESIGQPVAPEAPFSLSEARELQNQAFVEAMKLLPANDEDKRKRVYALLLQAAGGIAAGSITEKR